MKLLKYRECNMAFQFQQIMRELKIYLTNPCSGPFCTDGNCKGCKDGHKWCLDPRCAPFCPQCYISDEKTADHAVSVSAIVIISIALALIIFIAYGPIEYEDVVSIM